MLIRDGLGPYLWQRLPKRDFRLLIDPNCLNLLSAPHQSEILQFIVELRVLSPPIHIQLLTPEKPDLEEPLIEVLPERLPADMYVPVRLDEDDPRNRLLDNNPSAMRERALCALAVCEKVDGIVTASATLLHDMRSLKTSSTLSRSMS